MGIDDLPWSAIREGDSSQAFSVRQLTVEGDTSCNCDQHLLDIARQSRERDRHWKGAVDMIAEVLSYPKRVCAQGRRAVLTAQTSVRALELTFVAAGSRNRRLL